MAFSDEEMKQLDVLLDHKLKERLHPVYLEIGGLKYQTLELFGMFKSIDEKVGYLHQRMNERFTVVDSKVDAISNRLDSYFTMESEDVAPLYRDVRKLKHRTNDHEKRINILES